MILRFTCKHFEIQVNNLNDDEVENKFNLTMKKNIILTGFDTTGKIKTYTNIREV